MPAGELAIDGLADPHTRTTSHPVRVDDTHADQFGHRGRPQPGLSDRPEVNVRTDLHRQAPRLSETPNSRGARVDAVQRRQHVVRGERGETSIADELDDPTAPLSNDLLGGPVELVEQLCRLPQTQLRDSLRESRKIDKDHHERTLAVIR